MKFGKLLRASIDEAVPDWRSSFLSYKQLKRRIKHLPPLSEAMLRGEEEDEEGASANEGADEGKKQVAVECEADFVQSLNEELDKINDFFIEKEEDFVIRVRAIDERHHIVAGSENLDDWLAFQTSLVELHGEMVLVLNWSMLNFTGLVKLLKKHDKLTGKKLREDFLAHALKHPFKSTRVISKIVCDVESLIEVATNGIRVVARSLTDAADASMRPIELTQVVATPEKINEAEGVDTDQEEQMDLLLKRTCAAIDTWAKIRPGGDAQEAVSKPPVEDEQGTEAAEPAEKRARVEKS